MTHTRDMPRRALLKGGALLLAGAAGFRLALGAEQPVLTFGLLSDVHYAQRDPTRTRFYQLSLGKMHEAVTQLNRRKPGFVAHLGDFIDSGESLEQEISHLRTIDAAFGKLSCDRHYVLGNHCVNQLTKAEFIEHSAARQPHYSFDAGGVHFVILDACYRADGVPYSRENFDWTDTAIPAAELRWLERDLAKAGGRTIVFAHQRLDLEDTSRHAVKNASAVRAILEKSGKVAAVFQGHSHKNEYRSIAGIHYTTLVAMVEGEGAENSGYALASLYADGSLALEGFRRQGSYHFEG